MEKGDLEQTSMIQLVKLCQNYLNPAQGNVGNALMSPKFVLVFVKCPSFTSHVPTVHMLPTKNMPQFCFFLNMCFETAVIGMLCFSSECPYTSLLIGD